MNRNNNLAVLAAGLCLLDACGGGNGGGDSAAPPTVTISAKPSSITLGQPATLTWSSASAASCTASASPSESDWTGTKMPNGSQSVTPPSLGSVMYALMCTGNGGNTSGSATANVTVGPPQFFSIMPATVTLVPGGTQTFTVPGFNGVRLKFAAAGGSVTAAGLYTAPQTPGIYHVIATYLGQPDHSIATVTVWPAGTFTTPTGSMKTARGLFTATLLTNGKVLVAGGDSGRFPQTIGGIAGAELYDPSTGVFAATGQMTAPRYAHAATLLPNGKVLVTGGLTTPDPAGNLPVLGSAEIYDPATGTFAATANMLVPRASHTATLLPNGRVLIVGGIGSITGTGTFPYYGDGLLTAEIYDVAAGVFTATGSMSTARFAHTATLLADGSVLIAGGASQSLAGEINPTVTATAELYDPTSGKFAPTGTMHAARDLHSATLLSSGKVLVAGGYVASAEIFDPSTGIFTSTGTMAVTRGGHAATLLNSGEVLVAGGATGTFSTCVQNCGADATATVELFDPAGGTFTPRGTMQTARVAQTATLLQNGETLLAGGESDTAELYP